MTTTPKPETLPRTSREYLYVPDIIAFGDDAEDLQTLPVDVALLAISASPVDSDWVAAEWAPGRPTATVRILVGQGGSITPAVGLRDVWVRVRGAVEQPERPVGRIKIV